MAMPYRTLAGFTAERRAAIMAEADGILDRLAPAPAVDHDADGN
jgi:hypothetical protein